MSTFEQGFSSMESGAEQLDQFQLNPQNQIRLENVQNSITESLVQLDQLNAGQNSFSLVATRASGNQLPQPDIEMVEPIRDFMRDVYENPMHGVDIHVIDYMSALMGNIQSIIRDQAIHGDTTSVTGATISQEGGSVIVKIPCKDGGYFSELHNDGGHPGYPYGVNGGLMTNDGTFLDFGPSSDPQNDYGEIVEACKNGSSKTTSDSKSEEDEKKGFFDGLSDWWSDWWSGSDSEQTSDITAETDVVLGIIDGQIYNYNGSNSHDNPELFILSGQPSNRQMNIHESLISSDFFAF